MGRFVCVGLDLDLGLAYGPRVGLHVDRLDLGLSDRELAQLSSLCDMILQPVENYSLLSMRPAILTCLKICQKIFYLSSFLKNVRVTFYNI